MNDDIATPRLNKASLLVRSQPLFTPKVLDAVEALARNAGLDRNDFAELIVLSGLGDLATASAEDLIVGVHPVEIAQLVDDAKIAKMVLWRFVSGDTVAVPRTDRSGHRIYAADLPLNQNRTTISEVNVLALRMAHSQDLMEAVPAPGGYARNGLGMNLSTSAEELWGHSRGYWRVRPDADYILPTRLSYAPFLFKVANWRTESDATNPSDRTARYWAQTGWLVDVQNERLVALDGSPDQAATTTDLELGNLLAERVIRYPLGIRNPAVWIARR